MEKKKSILKQIMTTVGCIFLTLLLIVGGYVGYVFGSYSRIEDNVALDKYIAGGTEENVKLHQTYTAVTQNIGFGAYTQDFTFFMDGGKESRARSKESVIDCVTQGMQVAASYSPDFVLIQELDTDSTRSHHVDQREIAVNQFKDYDGIFAENYHSAYLMYPFLEPHGASNSGLMLMSKVKTTSSLRRSLPISDSVSKILDLDRAYSITRMPVENGKELVIFNTHMSAYGGSDEIRTAQMTMLMGDMKAEYDKGNYAVCGGDFNHDFTGDSCLKLNGHESEFGWSMPFPQELIPEGISRAIEYTNGQTLPSCRNCDVPYKKGNFTIIVDGFLVSDNVKVEYLENVQKDFVYSDHNPVVIKFSLQ